MGKVKLFCNNEIAYVNGEYVGDCCDSLYETVTGVLNALGIDYEEIEDMGEI